MMENVYKCKWIHFQVPYVVKLIATMNSFQLKTTEKIYWHFTQNNCRYANRKKNWMEMSGFFRIVRDSFFFSFSIHLIWRVGSDVNHIKKNHSEIISIYISIHQITALIVPNVNNNNQSVFSYYNYKCGAWRTNRHR